MFHGWRSSAGFKTQRLIFGMGALLVLSLLGMTGAATYTANRMDQTAVQRQRDLIDNAISLRLAQSLSELRSVAWWDEMVLKASDNSFDQDWLDIEVGVFVTTSYQHDRLAVIDEQDLPVYAFGDDKRLSDDEAASVSAIVAPLVKQIRGGANVSPRISDTSLTQAIKESSAITDRKYGRGAAALVSYNGKPALATAMAITPSIDMSLNAQRPRILVSVIDMTPELLTELGMSILVPDLASQQKLNQKSARFQLKDDNGKLLKMLAWTPDRPGSDLLYQFMPFGFFAIGIFLLIFSFFAMRLQSSTRILAQRQEEAQHSANHDALTGLANRRHLETKLWQRSIAHDKSRRRTACAIIDLDRFKDINDTLGHAAGDSLITAVAARLQSTVRSDDFIARLGGDEFAILRECENLSDAEDLAKLVATVFAAPFPVVGHEIDAGASVGIAYSSHERAIEELLKEADIALYEAKANQKGTAVIFAPAMGAKIAHRHALEVDLKQAVSSRSLSLVYQPIVESHSGKVTSVEALVRWHSPKHGTVSPDIFIGIAEETGIMADLGRFVIEQAMADSKRWPDVKTAINISPAQLRSATIIKDLIQPATANKVSPSQIILEVTESLLMTNDQRTLRTLNLLKEHGFSLALDDFGTGYSSLAYVRDFPFDKLKIDRSFVQGQEGEGRSMDIVKAVVNFGRILGREVVAEGVETEQEMQTMQAAGVTHLQGYLFSKPISASHLEILIATSGRLTAARAPKGELKFEERRSGTRAKRSAAKLRNVA